VICSELFDAPDAIALRAELEAELWERYGGDSEPEPKPSAEDTPVFLIARDGEGTPLGCGSLRWLSRHTVEIKRMFVRPSARRRGIAGQLLAALEDHALRLGARRVVLETGPLQPESVRLYEGRGYRRTRRLGSPAGSRRSFCYGRTLEG
jgi:GNAT superfamily N-acetyltransferase